MMQIRKIFLGLFLLGNLLIQILPVGLADLNHTIFQKEISGKKKSYNAYFPADSPYILDKLRIRPYPIRIWYDTSISPEPYGYEQRNWPYISIKTINSSGVLGSELLRVERGENLKGYVDLPANLGMYLDMYTGRYAIYFLFFSDDGGHVCSCKLEYQLDTEVPNAPMGLTMQNLGGGGVIVDGSGVHTRNDPVILTWNIPDDKGKTYNGFTSGPSPSTAMGYKLYNQDTAYISNWISDHQVTLSLPEGQYQFRVKARDFDLKKAG
jgi:hypothetical protein